MFGVTGGNDEEETDWRTKDYDKKPVKDHTEHHDWGFEVKVDDEGNYLKKNNG